MTLPPRLGGFKILKGVDLVTMVVPKSRGFFPGKLCRRVAEEGINIPYLTCVHDDANWGLALMVDASEAEGISELVRYYFAGIRIAARPNQTILSVFPHRQAPEIAGTLFGVLNRQKLTSPTFASSPSAISLALKEDSLDSFTEALFGPFSFGPYRTPSDWKLAQEGKEQLFKEVVASYHEKMPKFYCLEWHDDQTLVRVKLKDGKFGRLESLFEALSRLNVTLTFLLSSPIRTGGDETTEILFCLRARPGIHFEEMVSDAIPDLTRLHSEPVAVFSMNGPHFGDRHGIASALLRSLEQAQAHFLGLACSVASITGVLPVDRMAAATEAIQHCFDVPTVVRKSCPVVDA
jgi:aspartokinase